MGILDSYNEIFTKWSDQRLKINDIEREILYLEADLKAEKEANSTIVENEIEKARLELKEAETLVSKLESVRRSVGQAGKRDENTGFISLKTKEAVSVEGIEQELISAKKVVRSCYEFHDFVIKTYEEQMKLWEVAYKRYSLRISNLRERLIVEEAILESYSAELEEWKAKLQTALKKVS
jgi:hypothetical protein